MIKLKDLQVKNTLFDLAPILLILIGEISSYFESHGYDFIITEAKTTLEYDQSIKRKTSTHREGRAVDVRIWYLSNEFKDSMARYFNKKYYNLGALSEKTGDRNLIVIEEDHIHIQVRKDWVSFNSFEVLVSKIFH